MLYDALLAQRFAEQLLEEGIYAIGFFFPVLWMVLTAFKTEQDAQTQNGENGGDAASQTLEDGGGFARHWMERPVARAFVP